LQATTSGGLLKQPDKQELTNYGRYPLSLWILIAIANQSEHRFRARESD
jgi:hypothetical protein